MDNNLKVSNKQQASTEAFDESISLSKATHTNTTTGFEQTSGINNPYQSPEAPLQSSGFAQVPPNQSKWYHLQGRIGRLRYLSYLMLMSILMYVVLVLSMAVILGFFVDTADIESSYLWLLLAYIPLLPFIFYTAIIYPKRRLHDLNQSGWLAVLMFIPIINFFFSLYLMFAGGNEGVNQYGAPPRPNRKIHYLSAFIFPIIAIIGILAAIAIPAYQDYTERAQQQVIQFEQ